MEKTYVIVKWSRSPASTSYSGPTWDNAGIRAQRQANYTDKELAERHAAILSRFNPVGFTVVETP